MTLLAPTDAIEFLATYGGPRLRSDRSAVLVEQASGERLAAYRELRRRVFVDAQGLFAGSDRDDVDDDPRTVVLVAVAEDGHVTGGVRIAPMCEPDIGWWAGSRLVVDPSGDARRARGAGSALVRAACAHAEAAGALRFDATVQADKEHFFARLGWDRVGDVTLQGAPHVAMRWPIGRFAAQADCKEPIAAVLAGLRPGGDGFVGDDGAPVPGTDVIAACDAILPAMVERDPWWAGWCSVLVNANDLAAMGAQPVGLLDAIAAPTTSLATRVVHGMRAAADRWGVPVLGGHTQIGVHASLAVTMLGRTEDPVPGGGGAVGDPLHLVADLGGDWRPGYAGRQWDSTSTRTSDELRRLHGTVGRIRPHAAKDVSMAGAIGTIGMLAEASGCGATVDVAAVPRPSGASMGDWLTCFPGFAMVLAGAEGVEADAASSPATAARCGELRAEAGVDLRWPDGEVTPAVAATVVGLGPATARGPRPAADPTTRTAEHDTCATLAPRPKGHRP